METQSIMTRMAQGAYPVRFDIVIDDGTCRWCLPMVETSIERAAKEAPALVRGNVDPATYDVEDSVVTVDVAVCSHHPGRDMWFPAQVTDEQIPDTGDADEKVYLGDIDCYAEEPDCEYSDDGEHDWQSPHELVGGCEENPGVWGMGGVRIQTVEVCSHCGITCVDESDDQPGPGHEPRRVYGDPESEGAAKNRAWFNGEDEE